MVGVGEGSCYTCTILHSKVLVRGACEWQDRTAVTDKYNRQKTKEKTGFVYFAPRPSFGCCFSIRVESVRQNQQVHIITLDLTLTSATVQAKPGKDLHGRV